MRMRQIRGMTHTHKAQNYWNKDKMEGPVCCNKHFHTKYTGGMLSSLPKYQGGEIGNNAQKRPKFHNIRNCAVT